MRIAFIFLSIFFITCSINADTIKLTNGYTIYGHVQETLPNMKKPDYYMVTYTNGGFSLVKKIEVKQITIDDRDQFSEHKE